MTLIKKISLTLTFSLFSIFLFSQGSFGVRAGLTIPNQNFEQDGVDISFDANLGLALAVFMELEISDNFAIQPELAFMQKGTKIELEFFGETVTNKFRLNYLDVPILAKAKFGNESIAAYVAAGPSFGFAISGSNEADGEKEKIEEWDDFNRFELGAVIAGGAGIPLEDGQVLFDLRYFFGLSNLDASDEDITATNNGIGISVGYLMSF